MFEGSLFLVVPRKNQTQVIFSENFQNQTKRRVEKSTIFGSLKSVGFHSGLEVCEKVVVLDGTFSSKIFLTRTLWQLEGLKLWKGVCPVSFGVKSNHRLFFCTILRTKMEDELRNQLFFQVSFLKVFIVVWGYVRKLSFWTVFFRE